MSYFLTLRTGLPGDRQFSLRYTFASFEQAHATAESAFVSKEAEYVIEDARGPVTYRLNGEG